MMDLVERLLAALFDKDNCPYMDSEKQVPVGLAREATAEIERLTAALLEIDACDECDVCGNIARRTLKEKSDGHR